MMEKMFGLLLVMTTALLLGAIAIGDISSQNHLQTIEVPAQNDAEELYSKTNEYMQSFSTGISIESAASLLGLIKTFIVDTPIYFAKVLFEIAATFGLPYQLVLLISGVIIIMVIYEGILIIRGVGVFK